MNFSAAQFHNAGILQTIVHALAAAKIVPHRLEIEITESMLLSKYGSAKSALNDFGTGFSSLAYLRSYGSAASRSTSPSSATCWCSLTARPS